MSQINISNLTFSYNGSYDTIFKHVSFCIDTNWKLGFIGRNGKGKTTFFHLLMGKYDYSGHISSNVTFEHFPYDVKDKSQWTIEVISQIYPDYVHWQLVKELSLLEADDSILYRPFQTLSDGEQTKVLLAILFLKKTASYRRAYQSFRCTWKRNYPSYLNQKRIYSNFTMTEHL